MSRVSTPSTRRRTVSSPAGALNGSYYAGGLASAENANDYNPTGSLAYQTRADEVAYLTDTYVNSTATTFAGGASGSTNLLNNLASVQLSIWDIIEEGNVALNTSLVTSSEVSQYGGMVNYYLNQATSHSTYTSSTASWIQAPITVSGGTWSHTQDFTYSTQSYGNTTVPEPSPVTTILAFCILGAGLILRRTRLDA